MTQDSASTHRISRRHFLSLTGVSLLAACNPFPPPAPTPTRAPISLPNATPTQAFPYFPASEWRTSTPEEQGIDSQGIANMLDKITQASPYVHGFVLIRNGYLVAEAYFAPVAREHIHLLYSATKSVTSALVGIAIQEGFIKAVNQKVLDFFPEMKAKNPDPHLGDLTIEHLLTMSTGHAFPVSPNPSSLMGVQSAGPGPSKRQTRQGSLESSVPA